MTTGDKWPDGIAGGGLARIGFEADGRAWPLLLTPSPANGQDVDLDATTDSYVRGVTQIRHGYLLGGQEAVGRRAYEQLDQAVRS